MNNSHLNINYVHHMNAFYTLVHEHERLRPADISLYIALFHLWNLQRFPVFLTIDRRFVDRISKIGANRTYIKCMKQLHDCGLIIYKPPAAPFASSVIRMLPLGKKAPPVAGITAPPMTRENAHDTECVTAHHTGADMHPSYNNKQLNLYKNGRQTTRTQLVSIKENKEIMVPAPEEVRAYFLAAGQEVQEADNFYLHYEAIGWTLSGQPIVNWKAAAGKWIAYIPSLQKNNHAHNTTNNGLSTDKDKCYDEPF